MSLIPKNRNDLVRLIETNFQKLMSELELCSSGTENLKCTDEWTIKELLAIRVWWLESVIKWIKAGKEGEIPLIPAKGYTWKETPKLNNDIARKSQKKSFKFLVENLRTENEELLKTISSLGDNELLETGIFPWAGDKWPISRWISVNTSTQYVSARKYVRKTIKNCVE